MGIIREATQRVRDFVLPPSVKKRIAIEALVPMGWDKYVGDGGKIIAMNSFGTSAPVDVIFRYFGFTVENVIKAAKELL